MLNKSQLSLVMRSALVKSQQTEFLNATSDVYKNLIEITKAQGMRDGVETVVNGNEEFYQLLEVERGIPQSVVSVLKGINIEPQGELATVLNSVYEAERDCVISEFHGKTTDDLTSSDLIYLQDKLCQSVGIQQTYIRSLLTIKEKVENNFSNQLIPSSKAELKLIDWQWVRSLDLSPIKQLQPAQQEVEVVAVGESSKPQQLHLPLNANAAPNNS